MYKTIQYILIILLAIGLLASNPAYTLYDPDDITTITITLTNVYIEPDDTLLPKLYVWRLDGTDDCVRIPSNAYDELDLANVTLCVFANPLGIPSDQYYMLVSRYTRYPYALRINTYGYYVLALTFTDDSILIDNINIKAEVNKWKHICLTYDGVEAKAYENTSLTYSKTINKQLKTGLDYDVIIGSAGGSWYYKGYIAFVRIYSRALSESEISTNYNDHIINATDLVLFLDATFFNGTHYLDLSPYGNHGTPYGGVSRVPAENPHLWLVKNLTSDNLVHLRFFPVGSIVRFKDPSTGDTLYEYTITGTPNNAGLIEDYTVDIPSGNYTVETRIPYYIINSVQPSSVDAQIGDVIYYSVEVWNNGFMNDTVYVFVLDDQNNILAQRVVTLDYLEKRILSLQAVVPYSSIGTHTWQVVVSDIQHIYAVYNVQVTILPIIQGTGFTYDIQTIMLFILYIFTCIVAIFRRGLLWLLGPVIIPFILYYHGVSIIIIIPMLLITAALIVLVVRS